MVTKFSLRFLFVAVTLILLVTMLFPIFWMVVTSLKSNNDILIGRLWFSRYANDVDQIFVQPLELVFTTASGAVVKHNPVTKRFVPLSTGQHTASAFAMAPGKGLLQSTKTGVRLLDASDAHVVKESDLTRLPWVVRENIRSSSVALLGDKVYVGHMLVKSPEEENTSYMGQDILEGLQVFDLGELRYLKTLSRRDGLPDNNVNCLASYEGRLWVGTPMGLAILGGQGVDRVLGLAQGLPSLLIQCLWFDGSTLFVGTDMGLVEINADTGTVVRIYTAKDGLLKDDVTAVGGSASNLYIGSAVGLSVVDRGNHKVVRVLERSGRHPWRVTALQSQDDMLWLGTDDGVLHQVDTSTYSELLSAKAPNSALNIRWVNYVQLWKNISFGTYFKNSLIICIITTLIAMSLATLAAYALSRFTFPGSTFFSTSILATQMIPGLMFLIPIYLMFVKFNEWFGIQFINSYKGVIFTYSSFFIPLSIWILRSFFASIPVTIEEAARIDGCSRFGVFWRITLPLALPGIIATAIFIFLTAWDELMFATVLLQKKEYLTIPLGIKLYIGNHQNRFDLMMAAATVATLPVVGLFVLVQKWFVKGLTAGAVKG